MAHLDSILEKIRDPGQLGQVFRRHRMVGDLRRLARARDIPIISFPPEPGQPRMVGERRQNTILDRSRQNAAAIGRCKTDGRHVHTEAS